MGMKSKVRNICSQCMQQRVSIINATEQNHGTEQIKVFRALFIFS